jgi:hypothetical protein
MKNKVRSQEVNPISFTKSILKIKAPTSANGAFKITSLFKELPDSSYPGSVITKDPCFLLISSVIKKA